MNRELRHGEIKHIDRGQAKVRIAGTTATVWDKATLVLYQSLLRCQNHTETRGKTTDPPLFKNRDHLCRLYSRNMRKTREMHAQVQYRLDTHGPTSLFFQALSQLLLYHARTGMNSSCPLGRRDAGWQFTADISSCVTCNTARSDFIHLKWEISVVVPQICWQCQERNVLFLSLGRVKNGD